MTEQSSLRPQNGRYDLRLATLTDQYDILHMLHMFYLESPYNHMSYDFEKVSNRVLDILLTTNNEKIIILGTYDDKPVGFIAGLVIPTLFSEQKVGMEHAWFVQPDHRSSRIGFKLLTAFEEWCRLVGCDMIQMSSLRSSNAIVDRIYEGRGYELVEKTYLKVITSGDGKEI